MTRPLRSTRITGLHRYHGAGPPLCRASVLSPSRFARLGISRPRPTAGHNAHWPPASARRQVPTFHTRAPTKLAPPPRRTPPGQSTGTRQARSRSYGSAPVSMSSFPFRHVISGSLYVRLLGRHLTHSRRAVPATLSTPALDRRTSRWFAASPCRATAEDHQPKGQPLHLRCSTASRIRSSTSQLL